jgi:hypothetical protein
MKEVIVTQKMLIDARKKAEEMGAIRNSILNGGGNLAGFVGEFIAQKVMGGKIQNTFEYDLVLDDGTKVDVKSKQTAVVPKDYYDCSVSAFSKKQDCDRYAFVRVKKDLTVGWFLGTETSENYFKKARFLKKGEKDGDNGFTVRGDCYNLKISELDQWKKTEG